MMDLVRNPNCGSGLVPPQLRRRGPVPDRRELDGHLQQDRGRLARHRDLEHPVAGRRRSTTTDPSLKKYLHINAGDRIWYLTMNLTQAPFDDVHVRKAMNWVMDKAALQQAWGGAYLGPIANHDHPGRGVQQSARRLRAVQTPGDHGSASKAMAAMKGSKYDEQQTACAPRPPARTCCWSPTSAGSTRRWSP